MKYPQYWTAIADHSGDSYFGLGILRSADAGNTWTLIPTANNGSLSFSGLGGTHMAFSTPGTVVAAMATTTEGLKDGAVTANTTRGLYTSLDTGRSWTYDTVLDPGSQSTDATSSTVSGVIDEKRVHELESKIATLEAHQKELATALEDLAVYTPGGRATAINRDLSAVAHDLARLTEEWEEITAAAVTHS